MVERVSALTGHYQQGRYGEPGDPGVSLGEVGDLLLWQIAAWPDSVDAVAARLMADANVDAAPGPGRAVVGDPAALLRTEPLKWWWLGPGAPGLDPEEGATLDLSHSRTRLRVTGPQARLCLNRLLPLDLREASFPVDTVATTAMHHVAVTLWRSAQGFELFLPRGFAASLWEVLFDTAVQFGVEVQ